MTTHLPVMFARLLPRKEEAGLTFSSFRIALLYEVGATKNWKCWSIPCCFCVGWLISPLIRSEHTLIRVQPDDHYPVPGTAQQFQSSYEATKTQAPGDVSMHISHWAVHKGELQLWEAHSSTRSDPAKRKTALIHRISRDQLMPSSLCLSLKLSYYSEGQRSYISSSG